MKKYIVYQTTCKINNKIYIGVHETLTNEFDGYLGCGVDIYRPSTYKNPKTPFQCAVKKYGIKSFIRTTLKEFDNPQDAYSLEKELVNKDFLQRSDVYNLAEGGEFHDPFWMRKKVYMYDLDGNFEMEFEGVNQASKYVNPTGPAPGHLPRAIKEGHQFHGHQFSYEKVPFMKKIKRKSAEYVAPNTGKKVGKFDNNDILLETFNTMTDCVKAGYKNAKQVALGKRNYCKGYKFKYLD